MSSHSIEAVIAQAFVKPIEAAVQKSIAKSALRALLDIGMSTTEVVTWLNEVIREITPNPEPLGEGDVAGFEPNSSGADVPGGDNQPNTIDTAASKIEALEIQLRALQDEVRGMARNEASISISKRKANEANEDGDSWAKPAK